MRKWSQNPIKFHQKNVMFSMLVFPSKKSWKKTPRYAFFIGELTAHISEMYENPQLLLVFRENTRFRFGARPNKKYYKKFYSSDIGQDGKGSNSSWSFSDVVLSFLFHMI